MNRDGIEASYPLSPVQEGMLFHRLSAPRAAKDLMQISSRWAEAVDVPALVRSWRSVIKRHPILRVSFRWEGVKEPVQEVHEAAEVPLFRQDWSELGREAQSERLQAYLVSDRREGFDARQAPLFRIALFRLGEAEYDMVLTFHHAVLDGWSAGLVLKEVFDLYEDCSRGREPQLPSIPRPYQDYVDWSRQLDLSPARIFWENLLEGFSAPTPLVGGQPATSGSLPANYGEQDLRLPAGTASALQELTIRYALTLNTFIEGAWALLLSRYTGEQDVVFGSTWACRHSSVAGAEGMIGAMSNALPVRARLQPDAPLLELLRELRRQHLEAREFQHTPLASIQRWSDVTDSVALFETALTVHNHSYDRIFRHSPGIWPNREFHFYPNLAFPINLRVYTEPELLLKIVYDANRFSTATIRRMLGHVQRLLEGVATNPEQPQGTLAMLTPEEEHELLVEWNSTEAEYPRDKCIHELFEESAARAPAHIALVFQSQQLTYGELNGRANQLAHFLRRQGVAPETLVAISMERSVEMVVAVLGVLKAGGAYVPLDPAYPKERLGFMLMDTQAGFLLTQKSVLPALPNHGAQVVCLDSDWKDVAGESRENPNSVSGPENLAYVLYTSGSTGRPKGVQIAHRAVVNLLCSMARELGMTADDVVLALTTLSFDISGLELYLPLTLGARVVLANSADTYSGNQLSELLAKYSATVMQATPATWRLLLEAGWRGNQRLKILCGGEALGRPSANELLARCGSLWNGYGPTETTIYSTLWKVQPGDGPVLIGRPIANTHLYVLDARRQLVPVGVAGELYIGGAGLTRGYLNRPDLTSAALAPNPFSSPPGAYMYKTGDLVRYRPDGNVEFLGRIDRQVKIRGFRIELGEVEAILREHPAIGVCVVLARDTAGRDKRLIAYYVPKPGAACIGSPELRLHVKYRLPDYMVPSAFVRIQSLPLTPNGKVDSRALLAFDDAKPDPENQPVAPRTAAEKTLASIWEQVLEVEGVGLQDDFFELGGTSLKYFSVLTRIEQEFGKTLTVADLRAATTIEQLAHVIAPANESPGPIRVLHLWRQLRERLAWGYLVLASPKKIYRSLRRRLYNRLVPLGPVFGGAAFPYPLGAKILGRLFAGRLVQAVFSSKLATVRQGIREVLGRDSVDEAALIRESLAGNVWIGWRVVALSRLTPEEFERWVSVSGLPVLEEACQEGRGVVLVSSHAHIRRIVFWTLHRSGYKDWGAVSLVKDDGTLKGMGLRNAVLDSLPKRSLWEGSSLSIQLYNAKQVLERGGIIFVAADAPVGGGSGVQVSFLGRRRIFRKGFAELALSAGAAVIPVRAAIDTMGRVVVRFLPRLKVAASTHEEQVESLVRQYIKGLSEEWREDFGNINWVYLRGFLSSPRVEGD